MHSNQQDYFFVILISWFWTLSQLIHLKKVLVRMQCWGSYFQNVNLQATNYLNLEVVKLHYSSFYRHLLVFCQILQHPEHDWEQANCATPYSQIVQFLVLSHGPIAGRPDADLPCTIIFVRHWKGNRFTLVKTQEFNITDFECRRGNIS